MSCIGSVNVNFGIWEILKRWQKRFTTTGHNFEIKKYSNG